MDARGGQISSPSGESMRRRLSKSARQIWRFGEALASAGAKRARGRERSRAAEAKPNLESAGVLTAHW